ncbi:MAG TPA: beta-N-acetylhexosaminidase [Candidatus Acidoferrales bacterium]|nr:beta-N-acetylhexosaminidase [Candidatus Acidoferrales bacterium]
MKREAVGQLLFVGIPGRTLDADTRRMLEQLRVGGIVLFRRNAGTPAEIAALTAELHALPSHPLIAIDHEGGRVMRLGEPFTKFPAAAVIGGCHDADLAYRVGTAMGVELASVGIDVNFAPVLDVHSNPANPVIGDRAFGSDPELVSQLGVAMMRGLLDGGIIPCGKHFPGHGVTEKDSHLELPVVRHTRAEIERTELPPFRAAIAADVPMLMTAHVLYPALDAERPATLSRLILTDLLRAELGFGGVVVSDDLEMRAIAGHQPIGDAAIVTLNAGVDVLLVCEHLSEAALACGAIEKAAGDGGLDPQRISAALQRLQRLREQRARLPAVTCALPSAAHRALVAEIERHQL